jgi:hypothetical protein
MRGEMIWESRRLRIWRSKGGLWSGQECRVRQLGEVVGHCRERGDICRIRLFYTFLAVRRSQQAGFTI